MTGNLKDLTRNMDGTWNLTVTINGDCRAVWDKYREKDIDVEIKRHREKRSLTANSFCWALCNDIGKALKPPIPKEEVYRKAIRDVGEYEPFPVKESAVERFQQRWADKGTGWFVDVVDNSKLPGYKLVFAYYGSSTYDSKQMAVLIDYLVDDAEQLGLPIPLSKKEQEALLNAWASN